MNMDDYIYDTYIIITLVATLKTFIGWFIALKTVSAYLQIINQVLIDVNGQKYKPSRSENWEINCRRLVS